MLDLIKFIEEVRFILEKLYLKYGNEEEVVLLSQLLDKLIYIKMKDSNM